MKITNKNNNNEKFGNIPVGTTFRYKVYEEGGLEYRLYLKCCGYEIDNVSINAVELGEYYFTTFLNDTEVEVVDTELIVK